MSINERIIALRATMLQKQLDAYIIPSSDPHQSEYVAEHWMSRTWISGFTGSAGTVIITREHAGLWTDSRYFLQAEEQLQHAEMVLHKQGVPHAPEHIQWLADQLKSGSKVGCDGNLFSVGQIQHISKTMATKDISLELNTDLIGEIWTDRPALPDFPVFEHELRFAGKSRKEKLNLIREELDIKKCAYHLITTLDDIAWIFNLRGKDVKCNPVFISYAVVANDHAYLFINEDKVEKALKANLENDGILLKPYSEIIAFLNNLSGERIWVDKSTINMMLYRAIDEKNRLVGSNIVRSLKAIKNKIEIAHIKNAMLKDGVALTRLFRWLDKTLNTRTVPETEVAAQLATFRNQQGDYHGESFDAIVGYNGNGAIVHYRAVSETCAQIKKEGILLLDSGGQYTDGTTDITRTVALGKPTEEQKRNFTLVLKGHIALARFHFPRGTQGVQMDTLARQFLWQHGLNYGHGTGHGVGFFLNVHEPPQGFAASAATSRGTTVFEPGMFTSNEPGFYKDGEYGIRIENLVLAVKGEKTPYGEFLKFDTLTLFPIDLNLIDLNLLTTEEITWLNDYHQEVFEKISPRLEPEEVEWLRQQCQKIG